MGVELRLEFLHAFSVQCLHFVEFKLLATAALQVEKTATSASWRVCIPQSPTGTFVPMLVSLWLKGRVLSQPPPPVEMRETSKTKGCPVRESQCIG